MKRSLTPYVIFFSLSVFLLSCYYDNEEALYPSINSTCDTLNVTFSGTVAPMLAGNCLSCHSNSSASSSGNGIRLENYADVKANSTRVAGSIKHSGGYSPMPKNGGKLSPCMISQFDIWINKGMPNN